MSCFFLTAYVYYFSFDDLEIWVQFSWVFSFRKERKWRHLVMSDSLLFMIPWTVAGSSIHGIFQARVLEWVAISFSSSHEF